MNNHSGQCNKADAQRQILFAVCLIIILIFNPGFASPEEHQYQTGILGKISDHQIDLGGPFPAHLYYLLQIEAREFSYVVRLEKHPFGLPWTIGDQLQFRLKKNDFFLKTAKGEELKARLVSSTPTAGPLPAPAAPGQPLTPSLFSSEAHAPGSLALLGIDSVRGNERCVDIFASFVRPRESRIKTRANTPRKQTTSENLDALYPERLRIHVFINMHPCAIPEFPYLDGDALRPEFRFDDTFIESLSFQSFWKKDLEMKKADFQVLTQSRVKPPEPFGRNYSCWEYELELRSGHIPADEHFVLEVLTPNRRLLSRFTGKLFE